ncbi:hypothetical protein [Sulfurimonas sp.]
MIDLNSVSISKKIHVPLVASIVIGFIVILVNFFYSIENMKKEVYETESNSLSLTIQPKKILVLPMQLISQKIIV